MKNIILFVLCICLFMHATAQQPDQNWTIERTFTDKTNSSVTDIIYYDGLGRPEQVINVGASHDNRNIVTPFVNRGHLNTEQYLPFVSPGRTLERVENPLNEQRRYYSSLFPSEGNENTIRAFLQSEHEASPLRRITNMSNVGKDFAPNGKKTTFIYGHNSGADNVRNLSLNAQGDGLNVGLYNTNTLYKTRIENEDGTVAIIFENNTGQTILERMLTDGTYTNLDTYYVYDPYGNLVWIVPPAASATLTTGNLSASSTIAQQYCFIWTYDSRGLLISSKSPGRAIETYLYDDNRQLKEYSCDDQRIGFFYDRWGRVTDKTYTYRKSQSFVTVTLGQYGYDTKRVGARNFEAVAGVVASTDVDSRTKGMLTYEKDLILDGNENSFIERDIYYDYRCRPIQVVEYNHLKGISRTSIKYTFTGQVEKVHEYHQRSSGGQADVLLTSYTFDNRGRILTETTQLNSTTPVVMRYVYDELGRLQQKMSEGSMAAATTEQYSYNIQGQITQIDNPEFNMRLRYHDATLAPKSYTGNIAEWEWRHKSTSLPVNTYAATYDKMNRLTSVKPYSNGTLKGVTQTFAYDRNGNITSMRKSDNTTWSYIYNGNQRNAVIINDIHYYLSNDARGNMISDAQQNIEIAYNVLDLPQRVNRNYYTGMVNYSWSANGRKTSAVNPDRQGFEYLGSLVYVRNGNNLSLESAAFSSGRILPNDVHYHIKDHLGSPRVILNRSGNEVARYDFTPFGEMSNPTGQASVNRYMFHGKESQSSFGFDFLDYGARMYNPKTGSWSGQDPLQQFVSPYIYCGNNPFRLIDPSGMFTIPYNPGYYPGAGTMGTDGVFNFEPVIVKAKRVKKNIELEGPQTLSELLAKYAVYEPREDFLGGGIPSSKTSKSISALKQYYGGLSFSYNNVNYKITSVNINTLTRQQIKAIELRNMTLIHQLNPIANAVYLGHRSFVHSTVQALSYSLNFAGSALSAAGGAVGMTGNPAGLILMGVGGTLSFGSSLIDSGYHAATGQYGRALYNAGSAFAFRGIGKVGINESLFNNFNSGWDVAGATSWLLWGEGMNWANGFIR